jgi:hypothetical protein
VDETTGVIPEFDDPLLPVMAKLGQGYTVWFGRTAIQHSLPFQLPAFPIRRLPAQRLPEPFQLLGETMVDVPSALGELGKDLVGYAFDLGDPMLRLPPLDTEAGGELGSEVGVIQRGKGPLVDLDRPSIQGQPATIRSLHPVGDHSMSVKLRIQPSRGVLTEHTDEQPVGVDTDDMTLTTEPGVSMLLHPAQHRVDRPVMPL